MSGYSRTAVIAFLTFLGGGVGGFLLANNLLQKHYEEIYQKEIDDVKSYFKKKYGFRNAAGELLKEKAEANAQENLEDPDMKKYKNLANKYQKPDLHTLANSHKENIEDEDFPEEEDDQPEVSINNEFLQDEEETADEEETEMVDDILDPNRPPYLISYDKYVLPTEVFKKVQFYYYKADDVVCKADDVIVENPEDILGWDWIKELETKTTAFVRNEKFATDFEIHVLFQSYEIEVSRLAETDKERKSRRMAREKRAIKESAEQFSKEETEMGKKRTPYVRPSKRDVIEKESED